jgi:hypothetical protein
MAVLFADLGFEQAAGTLQEDTEGQTADVAPKQESPTVPKRKRGRPKKSEAGAKTSSGPRSNKRREPTKREQVLDADMDDESSHEIDEIEEEAQSGERRRFSTRLQERKSRVEVVDLTQEDVDDTGNADKESTGEKLLRLWDANYQQVDERAALLVAAEFTYRITKLVCTAYVRSCSPVHLFRIESLMCILTLQNDDRILERLVAVTSDEVLLRVLHRLSSPIRDKTPLNAMETIQRILVLAFNEGTLRKAVWRELERLIKQEVGDAPQVTMDAFQAEQDDIKIGDEPAQDVEMGGVDAPISHDIEQSS